MSDYSTFRTSYAEVKDQDLKKLIDHIGSMMQLSVQQAAHARISKKPMKFKKLEVGGVKKVKVSSVAEVVDGYLAKKSMEELTGFARHRGPKTILAQNKFGIETFKHVQIMDSKAVFDQVVPKSAFGYINDKFLFNIGNIYGVQDEAKSNGSTTSSPPQASSSPQAVALRLNLRKVKCLDETNPEWPGSDSISVGGVAVDDKQVRSVITEFSAGSFNDGTVKNYSPIKVLKSFPLDSINPSTFMAFVTLAEKDGAGFSAFLNDLYEAVQGEVQSILNSLGAAAGKAIGTAIGGAIGTSIAGPLGTIIGIVAGFLLGALIDWIVGAFQDDIFEPMITGVILNNNAPFTGPTETLTYQDFGGKYTAEVFWSAS